MLQRITLEKKYWRGFYFFILPIPDGRVFFFPSEKVFSLCLVRLCNIPILSGNG